MTTNTALRDAVHANINVVTPATGATVKPGPMVTAPPELSVEDQDFAHFARDSGLNAPFLADQLSAFIAHERDSVNMMRALAAMSANPMLQGVFNDTAGDSEQASTIWADLILDLGGNPQYASPAGRLTEMMDAKMQEAFLGAGSADPMTLDLISLQAALLGAQLCVANVDLLEQFAEAASGPSAQLMRDAAGKLRPIAVGHRDTALTTISTLAVQQAKHPVMQKAGQAAEKVVSKVKNALH